MPSIALFIKQLLSEDKYSSDFSDRISERIKELNAAQLQGIYNHLVITAKNAKSQTWAGANNELISKIEGVLKERVEEATKIEKILEEEHLRQAQKKRRQKEAKIEQVRVMRMITETARKTAEDAVRAEEQKRLADEKMQVMEKVFQGEEKRNTMLKKIAVGFVIAVVAVAVASPNILVLLPCLFFIVLVTGILCYKAHQLTVVVPKVVDEQELEMEIERRGDVLKKKAISALQEKERKFQEQVARDEEDRKQRKAQKKAQLKFEAQLMAQRRQQQLAMAHEVLSRQNSTAISMLNLSGRTTPVEDRSDASSYRDVATDYGSNPPSYPTTARTTGTDRRLSMLPTIHDSEKGSSDSENSEKESGDDSHGELRNMGSRASSWRQSQPGTARSGVSSKYSYSRQGSASIGMDDADTKHATEGEEIQLFGETVIVQADALYDQFERNLLVAVGNSEGPQSDTEVEREHLPVPDENLDLEAQRHTPTNRPPSRPLSRNAPAPPKLRPALSKGPSMLTRDVSFRTNDSDPETPSRGESRGGGGMGTRGASFSTPRVAKSVSFKLSVEEDDDGEEGTRTGASALGAVSITPPAALSARSVNGSRLTNTSAPSEHSGLTTHAEPKVPAERDIEMGVVLNIED
jgi:hypothetical protein